MRERRLVLFSGGVDSTVALAWAAKKGPVATLTLERPDRPRGERRAAQRLLDHYRVRARHTVAFPSGIESWVIGPADRGFVASRNLFFQAAGVVLARRLGIRWIVAGHTKDDAEAFADAGRRFFDAVERLANVGGAAKVGILTPFAGVSKSHVVGLGRSFGAPLELTWSCYRDGATPCGRCRACRDRAKALSALARFPRARARRPPLPPAQVPRRRGGVRGARSDA